MKDLADPTDSTNLTRKYFQEIIMKLSLSLFLIFSLPLFAKDAPPPPQSNTVVLNETGVKNLNIETIEVEETDFEETIFSLGHIEQIPSRHAVLSSRIDGRVIELSANEGDVVKSGQTLVRVESRQPGNPPPVIELKAPLGGLLTQSHIYLGAPVAAEKELLDISDLSEVYAVARVPENLVAKMKPGTRAHIVVTALGSQIMEGEMLRLGTSADRKSNTIDAVFRVPNPDLRMRQNMRAEFSIVLGKRSGVMSVPRSALQGDASDRFVYVKHFDLPNAFIKTPVEVGEVNDRFAEITKGLFPADEVVTRGAYSLSFAGGGTISLKAALDAAHGHEHNEDGSEKTASQKSQEHDHEHAGEGGGASPGWKYACFGLGFLWLVTLLWKVKRKR